MGWIELAAVIGVMIFAVPLVAIMTEHRRLVLEIEAKARAAVQPAASDELAELRALVTSLRDTATTYDLSIDQSLQRIEARTAHLEERLAALEASAGASSAQVR